MREFAIDAIMRGIKDDLMAGVKMDKFSSERSLVNTGLFNELSKTPTGRSSLSRCAPTAKGKRAGRLGTARTIIVQG